MPLQLPSQRKRTLALAAVGCTARRDEGEGDDERISDKMEGAHVYTCVSEGVFFLSAAVPGRAA